MHFSVCNLHFIVVLNISKIKITSPCMKSLIIKSFNSFIKMTRTKSEMKTVVTASPQTLSFGFIHTCEEAEMHLSYALLTLLMNQI